LSQNKTREVLTKHKAVTVVGLSRDLEKDSQSKRLPETARISLYTVNPFADEILG
jgi:predicted CoA-binding protein